MTVEEDLEKLTAESAEYKQKADEYLNSWKRTAADFENYKKRREREDRELLQFAQEVTVVKMLPTLESLEQALKHAPADEKFQSWSEGALKIVQQLEKVLLEMGVEKIKSIGAAFDPHLHEAIEEVEAAETAPGTIVAEIQTGYKLNNKVIRPAKVRVARQRDSHPRETGDTGV